MHYSSFVQYYSTHVLKDSINNKFQIFLPLRDIPFSQAIMRQRLTKFFTEDRIVFIVIMLNAVVLFLLSFDADHDYILTLEIIDIFFIIYFLMEAVFKIMEHGWKGYIGQRWNQFDFIILVLSMPSILAISKGAVAESNLSLIFLFRIARVIRFFKFLKFIPNIQELISGVRRAFKASVVVILAFLIYGFVISMISHRIFNTYAPDLFGTPIIAFYNIFKVFTIEGWYEVPESIISQAQWTGFQAFFTKFYFILIVATGGLFGLSIVNAIFVEEMVRDNNDDLMMKVLEIDEKLNQLISQTPPNSPPKN